MKFRPVRGSLHTAMEEVQEIEPTVEAIWAAMKVVYGGLHPRVGVMTVKHHGFDHRIEWDTWLVCVDGSACGYTDGPVTTFNPEAKP